MEHSGSLIQYGWCPYKTGTEESDGKTQGDNSHLQAKERGLEHILSHRPLKEPALPTPSVSTSSLQKCEAIHFCCLSRLVCDNLFSSPRRLRQRGTGTRWPRGPLTALRVFLPYPTSLLARDRTRLAPISGGNKTNPKNETGEAVCKGFEGLDT